MAVTWSRARRFHQLFGLKLYRKRTYCHKNGIIRSITKDSIHENQNLSPQCRIFSRNVASSGPDDRLLQSPPGGATVFSGQKKGEEIHHGQSSEESVLNNNESRQAKKDTSVPLPKAYNPKFVEDGWYRWWEDSGFFRPEQCRHDSSGDQERFVLCLPPPNVTGSLHLGHALTNVIEDALVRWHRMLGHVTLWNPGCDHAGIATQVVVEKKLWKERKKTRYDIGREAFIDEIWKWKHEKGDEIYEQMRRLGSSLDWSRACFTMDKKLSHAVTEAFVRLHDEGLIYRRNRLVNWSCQLKSVISDIEVDERELEGRTMMTVPGYEKKVEFGTLKSFAYKVDGADEEIVVATTRLETMLGDTAVAVHPDDPRYSHLVGKYLSHPFTERRLPVIADEFVDRSFGTGAVKITPGHSHTDFDVGVRHNLPLVSILDDEGQINDVAPAFKGLRRFECRKKIEKQLKQLDLFRGSQDHKMLLPICSRSGDVIEPRLKEQWYVDCQQMAAHAVDVVRNGELEIIPENHVNTWYNWMENCHDWCISRQLWWGHQIPAYRVQLTNGTLESDVWVSARNPTEAIEKACKKLDMASDQFDLKQDDDVLDTWFSSALFPFSIFGWPDKTQDFDQFHPTSLLETGSDILFFWVARMVMLGHRLTGEVPFRKVLLHGLLRDAHGRKMSKSLGNVIDPMDVIHGISLQDLNKQLDSSNLDEKEIAKAKTGQKKDFPAGIPECGTDALRFALCSYNYKAQFINMNITHVKSYRNFCNKIWQAFRFYLSNTVNFKPSSSSVPPLSTHPADQWILSRLSDLVQKCDENFRSYDLHLVTKALYQFWYQDLCDVYLEIVKEPLKSSDTTRICAIQQTLHTCIDVGLRATSPFMPYLTEELYQRLRGGVSAESVCVATYPTQTEVSFTNQDLDDQMELVREVATKALSLRKMFNLTKTKAHVYLICDNAMLHVVETFSEELKCLTRSKSITTTETPPEGCVSVTVRDGCQLCMELKGLIDPQEQLKEVERKKNKLETELAKLRSRLEGQEEMETQQKEKLNDLQKNLKEVQEVHEMLKTLL